MEEGRGKGNTNDVGRRERRGKKKDGGKAKEKGEEKGWREGNGEGTSDGEGTKDRGWRGKYCLKIICWPTKLFAFGGKCFGRVSESI